MTTTPTAKERVQGAGGTAAEETKHVGAVAKDELGTVAGEAKGQARQLVNEALGQVSDQSRSQKDRLVSTLSTLSDDLDSMSAQAPSGLATDLTRQAASRARGLVSQLDNREPAELMDDLRSFARRKPGAFLLSALAAGVVAGRLGRGIKEAQSDQPSSPRGYATGPSVSGYSSSLSGTGTGPAYAGSATLGGSGYAADSPYGNSDPDLTTGTGTGMSGTSPSGTGLPLSTGTVATGPTGATGPVTEADLDDDYGTSGTRP